MNIGQAIVLLTEKYEYAKKQDYIVKKVAWSLYQTWKGVDGKEEKQNESNNRDNRSGCNDNNHTRYSSIVICIIHI